MRAATLRSLVLVVLLFGAEVAHAGLAACVAAQNRPSTWVDEIIVYTVCLANGDMSRNDTASALRRRAYAYFRHGEAERALEDVSEALDYDPESNYTYYLRGIIHLDRDELDLADQDFTTLIERTPRFSRAGAYAYRGAIRMSGAHCPDALRDLDEAISLNRKMAFAYLAKAWILATCVDKQVRNGPEAIKLAKTAISFEYSWRGHAVLATGYAEEGQFKNAIREVKFAQALLERIDPMSPCLPQLREQRASYEAGRLFSPEGSEGSLLTTADTAQGNRVAIIDQIETPTVD